jgi:hypothetical protein
MRWIRGIVNAVLMATLVTPVARRLVAGWRRRAQESAATTIGIPVQELLETALIEELAAPGADLQPSAAATAGQAAGRSMIRTMIIAGAVVAVTAGAAVAIATLIRRRREAHEAQAKGSERVAVPVDASTREAEEAVPQEVLTG